MAGPDAFKAWALGMVAKGYTGITSLWQKVLNVQTQVNAATAESDDLDVFLSQFYNLSIIGLPKHYGVI